MIGQNNEHQGLLRDPDVKQKESMDFSLLKALEKEKVLEVLQRDKVLRSVDDERVR